MPRAASIDRQSVKTRHRAGVRGYDGHKQVNGRKRHIVVDTQGLLLKVVVHSAGLVDTVSGYLAVKDLPHLVPTLKQLWVDAGYRGEFVEWVKKNLGWTVEVVQHPSRYTYAPVDEPPPPVTSGFAGLPRRWVVERTFAWFGFSRRLSKDYEFLPSTSETWMYMTRSKLMLRRLTHGAFVAPPANLFHNSSDVLLDVVYSEFLLNNRTDTRIGPAVVRIPILTRATFQQRR